MRTWNPRYVEYARQVPGGVMAGFIIWMSQRWEVFRVMHQCRRDADWLATDEAQTAFDAWLQTRA